MVTGLKDRASGDVLFSKTMCKLCWIKSNRNGQIHVLGRHEKLWCKQSSSLWLVKIWLSIHKNGPDYFQLQASVWPRGYESIDPGSIKQYSWYKTLFLFTLFAPLSPHNLLSKDPPRADAVKTANLTHHDPDITTDHLKMSRCQWSILYWI